MSKRLSVLLIIYLVLGLGSTLYSQGKLSGYMFGDYYYILNNHDADLEKRNGFWFRRIYFTYDQGLSEEFAVRLRIEMANSGDFSSNSKLEPFVKDAYLKWTRSGRQIFLGISTTPTWGYIESMWGYRSVEKTPADLYKFGSSRDFGVAVKGRLGAAQNVGYHVMLSNGSSTGSETNAGKKVALALNFEVRDGLNAEVYGDFEARPGESDRFTAQGFLFYQQTKFRLGLQLLHQTRQANPDDVKLMVGSLFGAAELSEKVWGFARIDRTFDPIPGGPSNSYLPFDGNAKFVFLLAGLDFTPHKQVHFMPNVEWVYYGKVNGTRPNSDFIPRFTFYYTWN